jgi:ribose-phosphate pyrophosphokinase
MILFAFDAYRSMAGAITRSGSAETGQFNGDRYENGEMHIHLQTRVAGLPCIVLGAIGPADDQFLATMLLAHTLKKDGARSVTALLPYLAYARHDKDKPGESLATAWTGLMARASGLDEVITVDIHSERARRLYPIPVLSVSPAEVFAAAINRHGLRDATLVAPDEGAIPRCRAVAMAAGLEQAEIPFFRKQRTAGGITHAGPIGKTGRRVVLVDDILDTGATLLSACEKLQAAGVEDISILVTHGLFTGERWTGLWELGVQRLFCTDSIPAPHGGQRAGVVSLPVASLLEQQLFALVSA